MAETLSGEPKDGSCIDEAVDGSNGGGFGREKIPPLAKAGVGGEYDRALAVSGGNQAEEVVGGLGVERLIAKLVNE